MPPIDLYLDSRLALFRDRLANSQAGKAIQEACRGIQRRLRNKKGRRQSHREIPSLAKDKWAEERILDLGENTESKRVLEAWVRRWLAGKPDTWDRVLRPPDSKVLRLHTGLCKAESTALVQFRTGCTGLAYFLYRARVPGIESGLCRCGSGIETPRHMLIHCQMEELQRRRLREICGGRLDLKELLDNPKYARAVSRWILSSGRLPQFSLATALLYE